MLLIYSSTINYKWLMKQEKRSFIYVIAFAVVYCLLLSSCFSYLGAYNQSLMKAIGGQNPNTQFNNPNNSK